MEATYPTKAIILKREARGEDDSRVIVYTYDHGKLELIARGTKKIKSKLAGHLEPLCLSNIMVVNGKQYNYVGAVISKNCFSSIKADLDRLIEAGRGTNVFNKLVKENLRDEKLYDLLRDYLELLNSFTTREKKYQLCTDIFIFKLIALLGKKPELYNCVECKKKIIPSDINFNFLSGGLVCEKCKKAKKSQAKTLTISEDCIKVLRLTGENDFKAFVKLNTNTRITKEINRFISNLVEFFY